MSNKMLIDASHHEETRVVVVRNGEIDEFDFEAAARKLLKGSIFLAKVTRVEPSLQAAFVDYGGNRHGFLAFNEIHPDYYQIPHADRLALLQEEEAAHQASARDDDDEDGDEEGGNRRSRRRPRRRGDRATRVRSRAASNERTSDDDVDDDADAETAVETSEAAIGQADLPELDAEAIEAIEAAAIDVTGYLPPFEGPSMDDAEPAAEESASQDGSSDGEPSERDLQASAPEVDDASCSEDDEAAPAKDASDEEAKSAENADENSDGDDDSRPSARKRRQREQPMAMRRDETISQDVAPSDASEVTQEASAGSEQPAQTSARNSDDDADEGDEDHHDDEPAAEEIGNDSHEDVLDEVRPRRRRARSYKIQEVIKRRQVVLVQVVKEERGTKGAALTTYLSLAGRYTVLMPNTARGGGISRKITNAQDRKRLKAIAQELDVPEGMGLIIRTAGAARTKQEIKRDFEYLLRLWESVRDLTLRSTAPALVYEEGDLIKRSIRDLYAKDIDEVCVSGEEAYKEAKDFMRMLMPSHAKNVVKYDGSGSLFADYRVEQQLAEMFSPIVSLPSGGYLVINQTEALVAIDINSGKATREFSIEETALKTNLEAAEEISRQLKLRDLAGLVVIDFIDMDEKRNNRAVERRIKECLKRDRARIQVGRISHFGLLEMSRQRLRTGVLEGSTTQCPHCQGSGIIRSVESIALAVLRGIEDALMRDGAALSVKAPVEVAFYLLNQKRQFIGQLEDRYDTEIRIVGSATAQGANFEIERISEPRPHGRRAERAERAERRAVRIETGFEDHFDAGDDAFDEGEGTDAEATSANGRRRRRRRGGRRSDADLAANAATQYEDGDDQDEGEDERVSARDSGDEDAAGRSRRSRRRGRRGGRRTRDRADNGLSDLPGFDRATSAYAVQSVTVAAAALRAKSGEAITAEDMIDARLIPLPSREDDQDEASADEGRSDRHRNGARGRRRGSSQGRDEEARAGESQSGDETDGASEQGEAQAAPAESEAPADAPAGEVKPAKVQDASADQPAEAEVAVSEVEQSAPESATPESSQQAAPETSPETLPETGSQQGEPGEQKAKQAEAEKAPAEPKRRQRSLKSTAPVVQRVHVGNGDGNGMSAETAESVGAGAQSEDKPQRKGWWQRTFGA